MTALQLDKRVIDHVGQCYYCDRAVLSDSAYILYEQSSEGDREHIERPSHNTPDSMEQYSLPVYQSMPFSFNLFLSTTFNRRVIGITLILSSLIT